ncbi:Origin recognition complex, subunit 1, partial [Coemansia biformis]
MALGAQQGKIAERLSKAARQPHAARRNRAGHGSDDEPDATVEWGQRLDSQGSGSVSAGPPGTAPPRMARRVTRQSGMTNKELYRSVLVNGAEYSLGQAVRVKSSSEEPYAAIIFKLWENEQGAKQVVARWLLRRSEMFLHKKASPMVDAEPSEVFYSNADDLITPDMILGPLQVVSHSTYTASHASSPKPPRKKGAAGSGSADVRFCRRYFNEQSAFIGALDWDTFYGSKQMLDPAVDAEMFKAPKKKGPKGKAAATIAGRAKAAAKRSRAASPRTPAKTPARGVSSRTKRQRVDVGDTDDGAGNGSGDDSAPSDDDDADFEAGNDADEEHRKSRATPSRARARSVAPRTPARGRRPGPATPATASKRRMRLQDIQPAAVSTAMLRRASRIGKGVDSDDMEGHTIYEAARNRLHVSAVPDTLPCREDEFAEIYGHLFNAIEERNSMCMYISGVPGTGKTATVHEVIRALQENAEEGDLPDFQYIELNGMKMTEPSQAYTQLWQAVSGDKVTPKHAAQLLEKHFSTPSPRRHTYVVLMDELDLLVTKSQSIMYNFFDWPHRPHAKLVVVAIANTMDLPERMLHHKVSSRLGLTRINFQPYSHQQLMAIVQSRLEGCVAFDTDAIELCARKISAVSGDARRALDVCRRAVEVVEAEWQQASAQTPAGKRACPTGEDKQTLVTMMVIDRAIKEMYASGHISFIQNA